MLFWIVPHAARTRRLGYGVVKKGSAYQITTSSNPALHRGDIVEAVNGDTRFGLTLTPVLALLNAVPGDTYTLRVRRGTTLLDVPMTVTSTPVWVNLPIVLLNLLAGIILSVSGMLVGRNRSALVAGRWAWLAGLMGGLSVMIDSTLLPLRIGWPTPSYLFLLKVPFDACGIVYYRFMETFPSPLPETRMAVVLRRAMYFWTAVTVLAGMFMQFPPALYLGPWGNRLDHVMKEASLIAIYEQNNWVRASLIVFTMFRAMRAQRSPAERRRVAWLLVSTGTAVALNAIAVSIPHTERWPVQYANAVIWVLLALAIGYALLTKRILGISVVIRRTLQYLLARPLLEALALAPAVVILLRAIVNPARPVAELFEPRWALIALFAAALAGMAGRRPLLAWLDRRFFRAAATQEAALRDLLEGAQRTLLAGGLEAVEARLAAALHPESIALPFRPRRDAPLPATDAGLADHWTTTTLLLKGHALEFPRDAHLIPEPELRWLQAQNVRLLIPALSGKSLVGAILLGEKKSQLPWTSAEVHALEAVATQLALAHENRLLETSRAEAVIEERTRIARELHDTLAQGFAGINLHLESGRRLIEKDADQARWHLEQAGSLARSSLSEARQSVHDLRAMTAASELPETLRRLAGQLSGQVTIDFEVVTEYSGPFPSETAQVLYRIAQESLTNAVKHAAARTIALRLELWPDRVEVEVRDDGRGFDPSHPSEGYGLQGMRERARAAQVTLTVDSAPGQGTRVRAIAGYSVA